MHKFFVRINIRVYLVGYIFCIIDYYIYVRIYLVG
jgi:hypothetical protein